jgi:hypothetical protein
MLGGGKTAELERHLSNQQAPSGPDYFVFQATGGEDLFLTVLPDVLLFALLLAHNSRLLGLPDGALSPVLFAHFLL